MKFPSILLPLLAATVSAHTTFQALWVDGEQKGFQDTSNVRHNWIDRESNFPLTDVTRPEIACNRWGTTTKSNKVTIKAGSTVTAEWHHEPKVDPNDKTEPIDISHKGPVMAYLGKVDNSAIASPNGVQWFKIYEDARDASGKWGVERFYENKGRIPINIPSCVANGDYFLRVEIIGLHEANRADGAQLYPECAQISVTGGGNANPPTVGFPGAYIQNGVGLSYNLYYGNAPYTAPGPRPFTCGAGGNSPAPVPQPSSPAPAPQPSSSGQASSATAPVPSSSTFTTSTRATQRPTTTRAPPTYPTTTRPITTSEAPVVTNAPAPSPSTPATTPGPAPGTPTNEQIESFFAQLLNLFNQWKAGLGN